MPDYEEAYLDVLREALLYDADLFREKITEEARLDYIPENN